MWLANKTYNEDREPMGMPLSDYLDLVILCVCLSEYIDWLTWVGKTHPKCGRYNFMARGPGLN